MSNVEDLMFGTGLMAGIAAGAVLVFTPLLWLAIALLAVAFILCWMFG